MAGYTIYTDGASRGNPGPASYGFVCVDDNTIIYTESDYIGKTTNNRAEYTAVINALEYALDQAWEEVTLYSDSQLMINQLNGKWRVKNRKLRKLYDQVQHLLDQINVRFKHVPRENRFVDKADTLCNKTLDENGY